MNTVHAPETPLARSFDSDVQHWQLMPVSHLAVADHRGARPTPVAIRSGSFDIDPANGVGTLTLEFTDARRGSLRGVATRSETDAHGNVVWAVRGTVRLGGSTTPVVLALRDHGVVRRSGTWWWLSGISRPHVASRPGRHHAGAALVADLLLKHRQTR